MDQRLGLLHSGKVHWRSKVCCNDVVAADVVAVVAAAEKDDKTDAFAVGRLIQSICIKGSAPKKESAVQKYEILLKLGFFQEQKKSIQANDEWTLQAHFHQRLNSSDLIG